MSPKTPREIRGKAAGAGAAGSRRGPQKPMAAQDLIRIYQLEPHPEGGYFRQTYKSQESIPERCLPAHFKGARAYCTGIYYLLVEGAKSNLHRLGSDEMWHFYLGGPLHLAQIHPDGRAEQVLLGSDINQGQQLQCTVKAGTWFGAYPAAGSAFCLVGCTVAPGFEFADFELASRRQLRNQYPHLKELIDRLAAG
jgi:uncharacterized protein